MNKIIFKAMVLVLTTFCLGTSHAIAQSSKGAESTELSQSKLNNRRLDKNLDRYKAELDLSKKQVKQLSKIERRYTRLERKVDRKGGTRKDSRSVATQKREEMIEVLTAQQQEKLQALIKKGRFSLDNWFGK